LTELDVPQAPAAPWDLAALRARFPALGRRAPDGRPVVYLDGPGGSQVPEAVIAAMAGYLRDANANSGGPFATSVATDALIARAREVAGDVTGSEPEGIAFGANMTTLNFLLAHAVARTLAPGDEIVVTQLDHDANVSPWLRVADDHGLVVRRAPLRTGDGTLDLDALEHLVGERTRVVAFTLASNALGTIPDARRIVRAAHAAGALAWADGVHFAPHRRLDRRGLDLDVLLCSPYKFFGPHLGIAALRPELAERLPADRVRPADEHPPGHRFETGTLSHEALAGMVAAVAYLESLGHGPDRPARLDTAFARIAAYEADLSRRMLTRLADLAHVTLHGTDRVAERTPTFCLSIAGLTPRQASERLAAQGLYCWDGDYYALEVMRALGLADRGGALRIGFLHYTTGDEVERTADALAELASAA
jgi:cysteine desulfurase family protein (TIGR01976 family)